MRPDTSPVEPTDHPRVGGEHVVSCRKTSRHSGSSPRWRGAPHSEPDCAAQQRIIPALAGSTLEVVVIVARRSDHPRVGGEHQSCPVNQFSGLGSSPRWRGALAHHRERLALAGIIPALAGSTSCGHAAVAAQTDHPRVGGEHRWHPILGRLSPGSSPRWRGARGKATRRGYGDRIIPALAGSTQVRGADEFSSADHPRVGGEHRGHWLSVVTTRGSSPRWRGARRAVVRLGMRERIIPALAGSTRSPCRAVVALTDHPRVGGEHVCGHVTTAKGKRIIPALAGSTVFPARLAMPTTDHPRVGGEHLRAAASMRLFSGSSPRWRGARYGRRVIGCNRRIIPALAGSTCSMR